MRTIAPEAGGSRLNLPRDHVVARAHWSRIAFLTGPDALLVAAILFLSGGLLMSLPSAFSVDSWLALSTGREIWQVGLPHHETLTVIAHGVRWVDQQWLSQVVMYGLYRIGGLRLLGLANVALIVLGIAGAVKIARRLGARPRDVMLLLPLCVWLLVPAREVRTQAFVIPLFVATVYLLATDSRRPSKRVYWCFPILVVWANMHGSASLGAGLVGLRGLTLAWERRGVLRKARRQIARPLLLTLGAPASLLLTPYGLQTVSYYRDTMFNSALRHTVAEWQPITSLPFVAGAFFLLAGFMLWSFVRHASRTTLWERMALIALAAASVGVIRNVTFFALCSLALLPHLVPGRAGDSPSADPPVRLRLNTLVGCVGVAAIALAVAITLTRPAAKFELSYQRPAMLQVVHAAMRADSTLKAFSDSRFADWLLWRDPSIAGRIGADARWELLSAAQINRIQRTFTAAGPDWKQGARGYRLILLDAAADTKSLSGFLAEPDRRVLYDDGQRIVILRATRQAN
jgi:hypothetical protein